MPATDRRTEAPESVSTAGPSVPSWAPLACLAGLAVVLAVVVIALVRPPGPLDDPDVAYQRDGLLLDGRVVDEVVAGVRFGERPAVLLFVREVPAPDALAPWLAEVPDGADVRVVLPAPGAAPAAPSVVDPAGRLADAVGMPTPVDGGPQVGYAVVDSARVVRYATLDPDYLGNPFEIGTIAGAVR